MQNVSFTSRGVKISAHLHLPQGCADGQDHAAIVLATPGSSVKEQIGGIYAQRLASHGFLALTFDPGYQGQSGGHPRDLEDPATQVEELRAAIDFLTTQPFVDEDRIGVLGICAGGGYAVNAALTERRFKAVGTVVAVDIGQAFRNASTQGQMISQLEAVGRQRTSEARGSVPRRDPWIPVSLLAAEAAGLRDPEVLDAVRFYREGPHRHSGSTNRLLFTSHAGILGFDAFGLVPALLTQPLQVIVGGRRGNTGQFEAGQRLMELAPSTEKDLFVIEDAGHYDLYHRPDAVTRAVDRLVPFYERCLNV